MLGGWVFAGFASRAASTDMAPNHFILQCLPAVSPAGAEAGGGETITVWVNGRPGASLKPLEPGKRTKAKAKLPKREVYAFYGPK